MAKGDPTTLQAKTGFNFRYFMEQITAGGEGASSPDDATFVEVEGMKSGSLPSPDKPEIDVTTTTDEVKAYLPGIGSINDISLEFNFYPQNEVHQEIVKTVLYEDRPRFWKITGQGMSWIFLGYLKSASATFGVDAALSLPLTLKVTNKPGVTFGAVTKADKKRSMAEIESFQ